jgi:hypothetical protein
MESYMGMVARKRLLRIWKDVNGVPRALHGTVFAREFIQDGLDGFLAGGFSNGMILARESFRMEQMDSPAISVPRPLARLLHIKVWHEICRVQELCQESY